MRGLRSAGIAIQEQAAGGNGAKAYLIIYVIYRVKRSCRAAKFVAARKYW